MISAKVDRFDAADLQALLGPDVRAQILSEAARDIVAQTDAANAAAIGGAVSHLTTVDGSVTEDIGRVRAEGTIVRTYDLMPGVLVQIGEWLWQHSPVRTGRYQHSHRLEADGNVIADVTDGWTLPALPQGVNEFTFLSTVFYADPIEPHGSKPGESRQAPDGVYQVVAEMAKAAFGALAAFSFEYRGIDPALVIRPL
jgi:hypothetical protein